jgi:hypothetical protein
VKTLTILLALVSLPLACARAVQSGPDGPNAADSGPITFTLTVNDALIESLKKGQSLVSMIPPEIQGKVNNVRIEYKPSSLQPSAAPSEANSILDRSSNQLPDRFDNREFGQRSAFDDSTQTDAGSRLARSGGVAFDLNASTNPNLSGTSLSPWQNPPNLGNTGSNLSPNPALGRNSPEVPSSTRQLTPVTQRDSWFLSNRRDSNASSPENRSDNRLASSSPTLQSSQLDRSSLAVTRGDGGAYSPPPPPRTVPDLSTGGMTSGLAVSSPGTTSFVADRPPGLDQNSMVPSSTPETLGSEVLAAAQANSRNEQRAMVYLFTLLMCSLGLNAYLGWISRGFYVRYHELAGELRDTFTPSSAA